MNKFISRFLLGIVFATTSIQTIAETETTWDLLKFEGSKMFITLSSTVQREYLSTKQAQAELVAVEGHQSRQLNSDKVSKLTLKNSVLGNDTHFVVWQNPDLGVLQRTSLYSGIKDWYRRYTFLEDGAFSRKIKPESGENDKPWQEWSRITESIYPYKPSNTTLPVSESEAIFEALAQGKINKVGDQFVLHVFDRDGLMAVTLDAVAEEKISVEYKRHTTQGNTKIDEKVNTLKITVNGALLEGDIGKSDFSFMGYKDGIILHYDPVTRLPLKLSGKADYVGHVEIDLINARFVDSSENIPSNPIGGNE